MNAWRWRAIAAAMIVAALALPAAAQTRDQIDWCGDGGFPPNMQIRGCTAAIQSGTWSEKALAWAYVNRGNASNANHDYDGAIADYDQALRLDPGDVDARDRRARAVRDKQKMSIK